MNYDVIADIHGHADALEAPLGHLGYEQTGGAWRHPGRQALFVGDFIDHEPLQRESVDLVRWGEGMNRLSPLQNSISSPWCIAERMLGENEGRFSRTLCPGKKGPSCGWDRDLEKGLRVIRDWGASTVVTLLEAHEFELLHLPRLGELVQEAGMRWIHLPIRDMDIPDQNFAREWRTTGPEIHESIHVGENVLIHCGGGM